MFAPSTSTIRAHMRGYSGGRPDVMKLIAGSPTRILDVGCGAGLLGKQLRDAYPHCFMLGIEPDPERASLARCQFPHVIQGAIDDPRILATLAGEPPFDLIICADVLEHLVDPVHTLKQLARMLAKGGQLITSLPNVRHISTLVDLYLLGRWPQRDRGIHDRTHLHFYARPNVIELGHSAGLIMRNEHRNLRLFEAHPWSMVPAKVFDFWPLRGIFTFQYLHRWQQPDG